MTLLLWLAMGVFGGIIASRVIPKMEMSNTFFAFMIAMVGSIFGGFAASLLGIEAIAMTLAVALMGAFIVLFFYRQYLSDSVHH